MQETHRLLSRRLAAAADRLDELAAVAEIMDDEDGALRLRRQAADQRAEAMSLLDEDG